MNLSAVFIARPVATTLLSLGVAIAGVLSYALLPVAPLPQVDYPAISVQASMPGCESGDHGRHCDHAIRTCTGQHCRRQ